MIYTSNFFIDTSDRLPEINDVVMTIDSLSINGRPNAISPGVLLEIKNIPNADTIVFKNHRGFWTRDLSIFNFFVLLDTSKVAEFNSKDFYIWNEKLMYGADIPTTVHIDAIRKVNSLRQNTIITTHSDKRLKIYPDVSILTLPEIDSHAYDQIYYVHNGFMSTGFEEVVQKLINKEE